MPVAESLKQRIQRGDVIVSLRVPVTIDRGPLEAALGKGAYDLLYIDGQHTAFSDDQLVAVCGLAEELDLPVQFRIPHTRQAHMIGRYLDLGLTAILTPEVVDEATVDDSIAFSYYPRIGRRSWGGAARRGVRTQSAPTDRQEYAAWWNNFVVLGIQLESVEAIDAARTLAKSGVDYVAFGPNDLSFSLEGNPDYPHRTVLDCMRHVAEQLDGSGIRLGMAVTTTPDEREPYLAMGVTIFQEAPHA